MNAARKEGSSIQKNGFLRSAAGISDDQFVCFSKEASPRTAALKFCSMQLRIYQSGGLLYSWERFAR